MRLEEDLRVWNELLKESKRPASMRPYVGHVRVPTNTFLAADAELSALRSENAALKGRIALLERVAEADRAIDAIVCVGDYIYDVREREGKGWEGPKVVAFGEAVSVRKKYLAAAREG